MKRIYLKVALACVLCIGSLSAAAQTITDPKYGATQEERDKNIILINNFKSAYGIGASQYDQALIYLKQIIRDVPGAYEAGYVNGANIYKRKIQGATSVSERNAYVDTLMMLYDKRLEYFDDNATRLRKATEYLDFKPTDMAGVMKNFEDVLTVYGDNINPAVVNVYFQALVNFYKADQMETDVLMEQYDRFSALLANNEEDKQVLDALFMTSGAADCDNIEKIFRPQLAANPDDIDLMNKVASLLERGGCDNEFFMEVAEKLYTKQPSSATALKLAALFENKQNFAKSREYLNEAIAVETDPVMKSNLALRIASGELLERKFSSAANFARQAIETNPENGLAYRILASAYVEGSNNCDGIIQRTVYWLVVDNLVKARGLVTEQDQLDAINKEIVMYSSNFPTSQDVFMNNLPESGQPYTVSCGWVSGRTTVRTR